MTVTYKGEIHTSRKGKNTQGVRSYSRTFRLVTDTKADGVFDVGSHSSLPVIGDNFPGDLYAYCSTLSVECTDGFSGWTVTADYTTTTSTIDRINPADNGEKISWSSEIYQEPVFIDTQDPPEAVLNSAGDLFLDPSPTRDASHLIARVKKNVTSVPSWILQYQNAVNSGAITIGGLSIGAGLAKVQRIEIGEGQIFGTATFYPLSLEIHIHKDGWRLKPLDAGFRKRNADGDLVVIVNKGDTEEVTQPVPLDGAGDVLADPTPSTAIFGNFTIYEELDFSALPGVA